MSYRDADVVVVGTSLDPHVDRVLALLPERLDVVRLDVDHFPKGSSVSIDVSGTGTSLSIDDDVVSMPRRTPAVGWFRRLGKPGLDPAIHAKYNQFALAEANHVLEGILSLLAPGHWLNEYWATRRAAIKPLQYRVAQESGLVVPPALLSNSITSTESWLSNHPSAISKTVSAPIIFEDDETRGFAFTHVLTEDDRTHLDDVALTPIQLQELGFQTCFAHITYQLAEVGLIPIG